MAEGAKKFKIKLKIDSKGEMDSKQKKFVDSIPAFKKLFGTMDYSLEVEANPKKWTPKKIEDELEGTASYGLKILATVVAEWQKTIAKEGPKGQQKAEKELPVSYKKIEKEIGEAIDNAADEIEKDKGDYKKGLRDGKVALAKLAQADIKDLFRDPRVATVDAFTQLSRDLKKAGDDDKKKEGAYLAADKVVGAARKDFDGDAKDVLAGVDFLLKTSKSILGNKNSNEALIGFAKEIDKSKSDLEGLESAIKEFDIDLDDANADISSRKLDAADAERHAKVFDGYKSLDKDAAEVVKIVGKLAVLFKQVERELK